jgi:hypothetical protein
LIGQLGWAAASSQKTVVSAAADDDDDITQSNDLTLLQWSAGRCNGGS